MKRIAITLTAALTLSACAGGGGPRRPGDFEPKIAQPSSVIQQEMAFNRLAQDKGQWTAFREYMADDATMFVPQPINAQTWLKGRADPAKSVIWQPHKAFMSCDGKTGVTTGAAQWPDGRQGYFTTVWQWFEKGRQSSGDGEWKVVLDHGDFLTAPRQPGEWIETKVASCKGHAPAALTAPAEGAIMKTGFSRDQSLSWTWVVQPNGARSVTVSLWNGAASDVVLSDSVAASTQ